MIVSLEDAKAHLRIDDAAEDGYLTGLIAAAHDAAQQFTDRAIFETETELLDALQDSPELRHPMVATAGIKHAMLLLVGHWYANRESVVVGASVEKVPVAHEYLLYPYRILGDA